MFGVLSKVVYSWLDMPRYQYPAFYAMVVFSLLAVVSKQPFPADKIVVKVAVGGVSGCRVPLLLK